jgi:hypothetical protein
MAKKDSKLIQIGSHLYFVLQDCLWVLELGFHDLSIYYCKVQFLFEYECQWFYDFLKFEIFRNPISVKVILILYVSHPAHLF